MRQRYGRKNRLLRLQHARCPFHCRNIIPVGLSHYKDRPFGDLLICLFGSFSLADRTSYLLFNQRQSIANYFANGIDLDKVRTARNSERYARREDNVVSFFISPSS